MFAQASLSGIRSVHTTNKGKKNFQSSQKAISILNQVNVILWENLGKYHKIMYKNSMLTNFLDHVNVGI